MNITIWYLPAAPRDSVTLHAWDDNGLAFEFPGEPSADGLTFKFAVTAATQDQRDVSFKYRFGPENWEADTFIRTVPTTSATELWTFDFTARCMLQNPGTTSALPSVTVRAITLNRYKGGAVYLWTPASAGQRFAESGRDEATSISTFIVPMTPALAAGFYFKLVGSANDNNDFEPDTVNRVWRPGDGGEVFIKSGQVDVQSQAIVPLTVDVSFVSPASAGQPTLNIRDLVGDFGDNLKAASQTAVDPVFAVSRYTVSVYSGAIYNIWWSTESQTMARRFRIPLDAIAAPSIAVNGYDHWLPALPAQNGQLVLQVHPNNGSTFGPGVRVDVGIGTAPAHTTVSATRQADVWIATISTFPNVPCWATLQGESRVDGPLDFKRVFTTRADLTLTLHTVDGIGGVSTQDPRPFHDVPPVLRRSLMASVYGPELIAAGVFDTWEMPHGTSHNGTDVCFVIRSPHSVACDLLLLENQQTTPRQVTRIAMHLTPDLRYWWCSVPAAQAPHGTPYRFATGDGQEVLDPASRFVHDTGDLMVTAGSGWEKSWSLVVDPAILTASFDGSMWQTPGWDWLSIYELHVRRFTQRNLDAAGHPVGDFDQVIRELQHGYLNRLPVTALELLPLHEFPGAQSWGYNPSIFFAIDSNYGGPEPFARMVRAAHDASRAVVLDVVYNHMTGSPLQAIARDVYVSGETAWGDMVSYGHPASMEFFRQALVHLWRTFRLDAFRFDSTETIVNGGRDDTSSAPFILARGPDGKLKTGAGHGWEFLGMLRTALRKAATAIGQPWPWLVGENDPENHGMTDPNSGVLDGQWHFSGMYAMNNAAINTDDHAGDVSGAIASADRPFSRGVTYAESHDSASGQGGSARIAHREAFGNGRRMAKAIGAVSLLAEGVPMIFMGQEAAEDIPFAFDMLTTDPAFVLRLNDYEQAGSEFSHVLAWFRDLMGLRNDSSKGIQGGDCRSTGTGRKTVAFTQASGRFFVVATFGTQDLSQDSGWLGLPSDGVYKEIFNSSWTAYQVQQEGVTDNGGFAAEIRSGQVLRLPPIGAVILERR